jgi:hypothetical protein
MRSSATLGEWNRRKTVLVACLAAAVALAVLAVALKLPWLGVAGLVVAAVGAMASLVINTEQARLASKRERPELDRRVKVPVAPITGIDPTEIGVDPAATQTVLGATVPEYVAREVDADLRGAIEAALSGAGSWMLVTFSLIASPLGAARILRARPACDRDCFDRTRYAHQLHAQDDCRTAARGAGLCGAGRRGAVAWARTVPAGCRGGRAARKWGVGAAGAAARRWGAGRGFCGCRWWL